MKTFKPVTNKKEEVIEANKVFEIPKVILLKNLSLNVRASGELGETIVNMSKRKKRFTLAENNEMQ